MNKFPLSYSADYEGALACPVCGFGCTHIDQVMIAARKEDESPTHIFVDAVSGYVKSHHDSETPVGDFGEGRRHRIALLGRCEDGHEFAIVFVQHKGSTFVEVVQKTWKTL